MKIRKLTVNGFRCLLNFELHFEDDLTVIVGENDAGKTSLVDCLKVVTQGKKVELDDFNHNLNSIEISVEIENFVFTNVYRKNEEIIEGSRLTARPSTQFIEKTKAWLENENLDINTLEASEEIKRLARMFGIAVRANSNIANLRASLLSKISADNDNSEIEGVVFPPFNNIQLDGRHFENISGFFKEVFLKQKQGEIWQETISDGQTIESFVRSRIDNYSNQIEQDIATGGVLERMQLFLKDLTEVKIEPIYQTKDLNIEAKVKFIENGQEVSIDKKGDGTKRRITMALLEYKKEQSLLDNDSSTIYLLDEPDTHLHVKAQMELLETIRNFSRNGSQVILTTHSPFIINSVPPKQLRLLENIGNASKIKFLRDKPKESEKVLRAVGVENIYLFFSRHLILVEGETEEQFLPAYFLRKFGETPLSSLIKIINCKGITNIPGFARAILEIHNPQNIHVLYDNDASSELKDLINNLNIPVERHYILGRVEFEDAFSDEAIHLAWTSYLQEVNKSTPESWTAARIGTIRQDCITSGAKFSKLIRSLNKGGKEMSKPVLGNALGQYLSDDQLPKRLLELIDAVRA